MSGFLPAGVTRDEIAAALANRLVRSADCWGWTGSDNGMGYGVFHIRGHRFYAHRAALFLARGDLAPDECACHHCDNPPCCNPDHLYAGSQSDNMRDMHDRGRWTASPRYGTDHHMVTVTPEVVAARVARYLEGGISQKDIAAELGIAQSTFGRWVRGEVRADSGLTGTFHGKGHKPVWVGAR